MKHTQFIFQTSFISVCMLFSTGHAYANIYKCYVNGRATYTSAPCSSASTPLIVSPTSPPPTTTTSTPPTTATTNAPTTTTSTAPTKATTTNTLATTTAVTGNTLATDAVFKSTSFWYTPIPTSVTLNTNSANLVKEFIRQKTAYYGTVNINTYSYSSPVYYANSSVLTKVVGLNNCQNKNWVDPTFLDMVKAVPIPSNAQQSSGTDAEMTIYQPSTGMLWELWKAKKDSQGNWAACWGGKISNTSQSMGIHTKYFGTTASGLPFLGGQITAEELSRGEIKHVIGISLVDLEKYSIYSWPANRSDGYNPTNAPNRIAEGQRFRLNPSVNVDSLPMTKAGKIIAKAAQKYGFVVWDHAGAISIRAQNLVSYTALGKPDPYPALYENKPTYAVLNGFPWDKLQFLPMNYGKPL